MTPEKLSDSLQHLDEDLIKETEQIRRRKKSTALRWAKIISAAAAIALITTVGLRFLPQQNPIDVPASEPEKIYGGAYVPDDTPSAKPADPQTDTQSSASVGNHPFIPAAKLTMAEEGGSMGFEGYMAYDISELRSANPWTPEAAIDYLPVYRNTTARNAYGKPIDPDFNEMETFLYEITDRLGIDRSELKVETDAPTEGERKKITDKFAAVGEEVPEAYFAPSQLYGKTDGIEITVQPDLKARIIWEPSLSLPEEYSWSDTSSFADLQNAADYLLEKFAALIDMEEPILDISGGDYLLPSDGKTQPYSYYQLNFYDGSGEPVEDILNYNFENIYFGSNEGGQLWISWITRQDLSEHVGLYPIISAEQAQQMLCDGKYFTTVAEAFSNESLIRKVELIYRTGTDYLLPYYRFYVELPSMERENGLKTYGAYYVPAVREEYLSTPQWGGWFN